ncbi:leucine-rich repeat protein [Sinanaerobacter sp. ZZT-01]|uniref:leucine-rich repeat protein n=1 Tax=Sinanaerobacter sp. ZZT-01 TaxID=3111540 RepID=UPI002D7669DA|nr:leucine-rich repeat protein [Sinanaerobacter sp. ZZT-01]WRR92725.1 leucine-rich repeat protein [Sinanaerobacter sp. ZZT-01]
MRKTMQILFGSLILMFCLSVNVFAATTEYDISPNGDGSSIGIFDDVTKTLTIRKISGSGATKDYTQTYISGTGNAAQTPWGNISYQVTKIVVEEGITELGNNLFAQTYSMGSLLYFENVEEIVLPSTLTRIGDSCFSMGNTRNPKLTSITVPAAVQTIGKNAFQYQKAVAILEFETGSKLTSIGNYAFCGLSAVSTIKLPSSVRSIGANAFESSNANIELNEGLLEIDGGAFKGSGFESIVLPATITTISNGTSSNNIFANCKKLKVVTNLSKVNQSVGTGTYDYIQASPTFYLYSANSNFLSIVQKGATDTQTIYLDEPVLSGTLDNGITWTYDPNTKILTFEGEGEIPSYTAGSQPWYSASYAYGIGGISFGSVSGIGSGAFSGLSFGAASPLFWGQHESLGSVLSGQTGLPVSYQGTTPTGESETEDKTGIWNFVDEQEVIFPDVKPRIQNGEILSPLRFIFQDLGATVIWNQDNHYAVIRKEENGKKVEIVIKPNSTSMWVNGNEYTNEEIGLDATVLIENGRLLLPGRAIIKAWETVQFKASRPSATVYEDFYYKTSEAVEGGDDKLQDIPVIDEWQEDGVVITPENEEEVINGDTTSEYTTPIILNAEASNFEVVVPILFDVNMLSTGEILMGSDYFMINNCAMGGSIIVGIQITPAYGFAIADYNTDFKNSKANANTFGISINSQPVPTSGVVPLNDSLKEVIRNKESKEIVIDIKLPAQDKAFRGSIAAVVFTVDFDKV